MRTGVCVCDQDHGHSVSTAKDRGLGRSEASTACQDLELRVSHVHLLSGEGCLLYRFFQTKDVSTIVSIQISEIPEKEHRILFLIFKNCLSQNGKLKRTEKNKNYSELLRRC